jgi:hypothetical protein
LRTNQWIAFGLTCLLATFLVPSGLQKTSYTKATSSEPIIYITPSKASAKVGESFSINVSIVYATDVFAWEFFLKWEPYSIFSYTEVFLVTVTEGDFLKRGGSTFFAKRIELPPEGRMQVGCTLLGKVPGVNGSGTLATLTFQVREEGSTTLSLYSTKLLDSNLKLISHTVEDGLFTTESAPSETNTLFYIRVGIGTAAISVVLVTFLIVRRIRRKSLNPSSKVTKSMCKRPSDLSHFDKNA